MHMIKRWMAVVGGGGGGKQTLYYNENSVQIGRAHV